MYTRCFHFLNTIKIGGNHSTIIFVDHKGTSHKESGYKPNDHGHSVITEVKTGKEDIKSKADGLHPGIYLDIPRKERFMWYIGITLSVCPFNCPSVPYPVTMDGF